MALPSDQNNADARLQVRFYKRSIQQDQASLDAGRPIFKDFDLMGTLSFHLNASASGTVNK